VRLRAKRDANEATIAQALHGVGATVVYVGIPGVPDLLVGYRGVNTLLEVKGAKGKLRPKQVAWMEKWRGQCATVRCVEDALAAIGVTDEQLIELYIENAKEAALENPIVCTICGKPFEEGQTRARLTDGIAHNRCAKLGKARAQVRCNNCHAWMYEGGTCRQCGVSERVG
jgi:hypothetical protein